jgi:hypothetical protein
MRTHRRVKNSRRAYALTACVIALLALPAAAVAMPAPGGGPIAVRYENAPAASVTRTIRTDLPPSIVREVRTVSTGGGDRTLPIVLAAVALGVALTGTAYVTFRVRPMVRGS